MCHLTVPMTFAQTHFQGTGDRCDRQQLHDELWSIQDYSSFMLQRFDWQLPSCFKDLTIDFENGISAITAINGPLAIFTDSPQLQRQLHGMKHCPRQHSMTNICHKYVFECVTKLVKYYNVAINYHWNWHVCQIQLRNSLMTAVPSSSLEGSWIRSNIAMTNASSPMAATYSKASWVLIRAIATDDKCQAVGQRMGCEVLTIFEPWPQT